MKKAITKKQLDEIYSRPEAHPFERLTALMDWGLAELASIYGKPGTQTQPDAAIEPIGGPVPGAPKFMALIICAFMAFGFAGCKPDKCETTICYNDGVCSNGLCYCEAWYEGDKCQDEMREKFYGTWNGTLTIDGTDDVPDYDIPMGSGPGDINQLAFVFDGLPIKAELTESKVIVIPNQIVTYSGETFAVVGSGIWTTGNNITLDFVIIIQGTPANYHYEGNQ